MWHEARRQEKKIRGLMVDFKRRADRRREFYEKIKSDPTQFLRMYGRPMKIHLDPAVSQAAEGPQSMMPWQGDTDNMIDRFDVRANLDIIPNYIPDKISVPLPSRDDEDERFANYESYRCLVENEAAGLSEEYCLHQIYMDEHFGVISKGNEEEKKKNADKKAAIGYVYEDSTPASGKDSIEPEDEDEESDEDIEIVDFDVTIDVDLLTPDQSREINICATQYGMKNDDFVRLLRKDKEEMEALKEARQLEEAKAQFSGRKSRKERRAINEKRQNPHRFSRPSYAARESPKYEPYKRPGSSSRSRSRSRSRSPEAEAKFITSFGDDSDDGVLQGPALPVKQNITKRKIAASPEPTTKCDTSWASKKPKLEKSKSRSRSRSLSRTRRTSRYNRSRSGSTRSRSRRSRSRSKSRSRRRSRSGSSRSYSRSRSRSRSKPSRPQRDRRSRSSSRPQRDRRSRSSSKPQRDRRSRSSSRPRGDRRSGSSSRPQRDRRSRSSSRIQRDRRSRSSSSSRSRSRSKSKSSRTALTQSDNSTNKPLEVKRYRRESLSSNSELSGLESDDDKKSKQNSAYSRSSKEASTYSSHRSKESRDDTRLSYQAGKISSKQQSQGPKLTPQERLKKKMAAQLSRQYKADKKERITKISKLEQERIDREEEIRNLALDMRRREREKRHRELEEQEKELKALRSQSSDSDSDSSRRDSKSKSRSPANDKKKSSDNRRGRSEDDRWSERGRSDSRWGDGAQNERYRNRNRSRRSPGRPGSPLMSRHRPPKDPRLLQDYN